MNEFELRDNICIHFMDYFDVYKEVWSTDKKSRIDIVLVHKQDIEKKYPFGIEVKKDNRKRGNEIAKWVRQAVNYSQKDFYPFGKLIVLIAPQLSYTYFKESEKVYKHENSLVQHSNINTFLGGFGIGEVMKLKRYNSIKKEYKEDLCFVYSGSILYEKHTNKINEHLIKRVWK